LGLAVKLVLVLQKVGDERLEGRRKVEDMKERIG